MEADKPLSFGGTALAVALGLAIWGVIDAFVFEPIASKMGPPKT